MVKKVCVTCGEEKDEDEFNWRYKYLGIRHPTCRECHHKYQDNWFQRNKETHLANVHERKRIVREEAREFVYQYLLTHPCSKCGEDDPRVLEFHHTGEKSKSISELVAGGYAIATIQAEIDRCIVLCASCHRKLTMSERGWYRGNR